MVLKIKKIHTDPIWKSIRVTCPEGVTKITRLYFKTGNFQMQWIVFLNVCLQEIETDSFLEEMIFKKKYVLTYFYEAFL